MFRLSIGSFLGQKLQKTQLAEAFFSNSNSFFFKSADWISTNKVSLDNFIFPEGYSKFISVFVLCFGAPSSQ